MLKQFKDKALEGAMKLMQSEQAQKVISSPDVQKAMMKAIQTGFRVKDDIANTRKVLTKRLNLATGDDLVNLKHKLDRLERRVSDLREENYDLKEENANLRADPGDGEAADASGDASAST